MIYAHWREAPWDRARWPNFSPREVACRCCGELYMDAAAYDLLQACRAILGAPLRLNSAHRCPLHNARVGGAPLSEHKKIAFDLALAGHQPRALYAAAVEAGFTSFGHYGGFLHVDRRPGRRWFTASGRTTWNFLATS